ncbi:MAG: electron transfer flavoprotein-ubiquinone oxidoreductase [Rhodospirillales bacterium]|nr:electron transfer flavoprotein-ubiquinone oxidoreductase [Rhodospirillales bacterium]MDE0371684.1 electron transfer flavoprotein-ubiquinone oxidoreductase [Rhodospirillales bacterium]
MSESPAPPPQREAMEFDVVIVGAGPAGLAAAIRLRQLADETGRDISVCVVEKASEVGAHTLSGAILDPRGLDELIPDWRSLDTPVQTKVSEERLLFLGARSSFTWPHALLPPAMRNDGNYIISLGNLCRWLAGTAESMGAAVFPGFAATELLTDGDRVSGVATGDMGLAADGSRGPAWQPGVELRGTFTLLAEGCRGSLGKQAIRQFGLDRDCEHQTYGLGLKELWQVAPERHQPGLVLHSAGWPLPGDTYGGAFLYHLEDRQVAVGFVVGLDYSNPHLSPFGEFQRFKTHPAIRPTFEGGQRIAYGARALNEGGPQSLPRLVFPGGALLGCDAGTLNVPRLKGTHTAIKSGMCAAEAAARALADGTVDCAAYDTEFRASWAYRELFRGRNVRPGFRYGRFWGTVLAGIDQILLRGRAPWTLRHGKPDHASLEDAASARPITYPKPDGEITFDRLTNVAFSGTNHEEGQPCHLQLADSDVPLSVNLARYDGPEQRYCPAGVYEFVVEQGERQLRINAPNCLHCKACDIKDPTQNITWVPPQGGEGPRYPNM